MAYKYLLEDTANPHISFDDIVNEKGFRVLYILCYSISEQCKYPFLQFMMDKIPYCNNVAKEQLTLPYIFVRDSTSDIANIVLQRVMSGLDLLGCDYTKVRDDMYKGIIFIEPNASPYALVNITGIDIRALNFTRQTCSWIVLPSEIINVKQVCNIDIDPEITQLFIDNPQIGCLLNGKSSEYYMLPDAVYNSGDLKQGEFQAIVGNIKTKIYETCGKYYYYYRSFGDAVKEGGWINEMREEASISDANGCTNTSNTHGCVNKYGSVNRYALFVEGKIYLESSNEFKLTDAIIDNLYPEPCIIISYRDKPCKYPCGKPDMLVKYSDSFACLSYHKVYITK